MKQFAVLSMQVLSGFVSCHATGRLLCKYTLRALENSPVVVAHDAPICVPFLLLLDVLYEPRPFRAVNSQLCTRFGSVRRS